jgi:hypothetical protein
MSEIISYRETRRHSLLGAWRLFPGPQPRKLPEDAIAPKSQRIRLLRAKERSQHSITQAARDTETGESFGSNPTTVAKWSRTARVARDAEFSKQRRSTTYELVATTGDRTQKGRRLSTPAFRITRR